MVSRTTIDDFLAQRRLALVGASQSGHGFGAIALAELTAKGLQVTPVHRTAATIKVHGASVPCVRRLADLAGQVTGVVLVTPPAESEKLVREAEAAGIRRVWLQQGAESDAAIAFCEAHGMSVVHHECILMFAGHPGFVHRAHKFLRGTFGELPA